MLSELYPSEKKLMLSLKKIIYDYLLKIIFLITNKGQLHVYIKPESKKLVDLKPVFTRSGEQGNRWIEGYIPLADVSEKFQVILLERLFNLCNIN